MDKTEFERYWNTLSNTIRSFIIRECKVGTLNVEALNNEMRHQKNRWLTTQTPEGLWYKAFQSEDSEMAEQFRVLLHNFSFEKEEIKKPTIWRYYLYSIILNIFAIILSIYLFDAWKAFFAAIMSIMLVFSFIVPYGVRQIENSNSKEVELYMRQLRSLYNQIIKIL